MNLKTASFLLFCLLVLSHKVLTQHPQTSVDQLINVSVVVAMATVQRPGSLVLAVLDLQLAASLCNMCTDTSLA